MGNAAPLPAAPPPQEWDPDLYRSRASFVHRLATDLVSLLAPQPGERILDLGCGTGELTATIATSGAVAVGVDASEPMITEARLRSPHISFLVGDGESLPFDAQFDAVFSNAALHWMLRAEAAASGIARALRPGGRLVAEFGGKGCNATLCLALANACQRLRLEPKSLPRWYFPDVAEYVAVLDAAGFDVRFVHLFERPTPLEGDDALMSWMRLFLAPLASELGDTWEAFARDVEAQCAPALRRGTAWVLDYVRLRVIARKRQRAPTT